MTPPDDLDLVPEPAPQWPTGQPDDGAPGARRRGAVVGGAVLVAALSALGWYWWSGGGSQPEPATQTAGRPAGDSEARDQGERLPAADVNLPPLDELDPYLRTMLATLSSRPEFARLLATDDLIRRFVVSVDRIGRGASPARQVSVLKPTGGFSVERPHAASPVQPAAYSRYAGVVATIESLDTAAAARIYEQLRPRLDEAYRELGGPAEPFDAAMGRAITHLLAVSPELAEGPVRPGKGLTYRWVDPNTENLSSAQKQLLRLGPSGAARVQRKLQEIASALGIAVERPATGAN